MRERSHHDETPTTASSPKPTPLQQRVLELAALGLSDDEIAARLKLPPRRIRFQLEKIFRTFGVRKRADAIAMWMESGAKAMRPVDECPYPKPFPSDFRECPAYAARQVVNLDERARPAGMMWTCQHLETRAIAKTDYRWYGACVLGDTVGRSRWADRAGRHRVRMINQLLNELAPLSGHFAPRLWKLKDDQVRALARGQDPSPAAGLMEALAGRFIRDLERFFNGHRRLLEANELASDECLSLARTLIDRIVDPGSPPAWDERFDALMRFPEDLWPPVPARPVRTTSGSPNAGQEGDS